MLKILKPTIANYIYLVQTRTIIRHTVFGRHRNIFLMMVRSVQLKSEITEIKNRWVDAIPNCVLGVGRDGLCLRHAGRAELPRRQNHRNIRGKLAIGFIIFRTLPAVIKGTVTQD
jgi:hypothetical protein